jgi:DegV family protein with EDD domain
MDKHKVALVTDSTTFLPEDMLRQYPIHVIPQNLHWGQENLLDTVDITPEQFYARLRTAKELPTTSQPSAGRFLEMFQEVAETAESIVCLLISADLSGTVASAHAARDMMERDIPIEIIDTRSASLGESLIVSAMARAVARDKDHQEVAELARALSAQVRVLFVVDTLEFLHRGGRIGGGKRFVGSVLNVKPILHLKDGKVEALASVRTKRKALDSLLQTVREETMGSSSLHVAVAHAAAHEEGQQLAGRIREEFRPVELLLSDMSPVIGTHTGPGALGVAFYDGAFLPEIN